MATENILVTGGCGFLGQYLVKELLTVLPNAKIRILDLRQNPDPVIDLSANPNIEILLGKDIRDYAAIKNEFRGIDLVIHLAGLVSFSVKDCGPLHDINVTGTKNVLKAAAKNNVPGLIHISSVAALGYSDDPNQPINEDFEFDWSIAEKRKKYYMLTKHLADLEVEKYITNGLNALILYPGLMLGPGDFTNSAKLVNAIKSRKIPFNMPGGTNIIDVRDVAAGVIAAVTRQITTGRILLSGANLTFTQINKTIADALSVKAPAKTLPRFLNPLLFKALLLAESLAGNRLELTADNLDSAFKFRYFDSSRAKKLLDWQPRIVFEKTVNDIIDWMNENGLLKG